MFVINEDKSIYITRGDVAFFSLSANTETGELYKFQPGDVVRLKVFEKKACDNVVLTKDFGITEESEKIEVLLKEEDTKIGKVISKPVDYWYEVELNPYTNPQTVIGYDEDGAKIFRLYPEGNDAEEEAPVTPEDVPVVDDELSLTSFRPVQNQAIARAIANVKRDVNNEVNTRLARFDAFLDGIESGVGYEEYELTPSVSGLSGKIISNGACAVLYMYAVPVDGVVSSYMTGLTGRETKEILSGVPERLLPLYESIMFLQQHLATNMDFYYESIVQIKNNGSVCLYNCFGTETLVEIGDEPGLAIPYPLANPYNHEVNDARINTEGEKHETLGAAIRSLEERIKVLEQKTEE